MSKLIASSAIKGAHKIVKDAEAMVAKPSPKKALIARSHFLTPPTRCR